MTLHSVGSRRDARDLEVLSARPRRGSSSTSFINFEIVIDIGDGYVDYSKDYVDYGNCVDYVNIVIDISSASTVSVTIYS